MVSAVVLSCFAFSACAAAPNLGFNVKKGDVYSVHQVIEQKITQDIAGQKMEVNQTLDCVFAYNVTDVDKDGIASVEVKYESLAVKSLTAGMELQYDSKKEDKSNPLAAVYGSLIGKGFSFKADRKGNVISAEGLDKLAEEMVDKAGVPDPQAKESLMKTLKDNFGDEALKNSLSQMINIYPDKKVKVGDSWQTEEVVTAGYPMVINSVWTLKGDKANIITVDVISTIDVNEASKPIDILGLKAKYKLYGDQKGTYKLNKSSGLIKEGTITQKLEGKLSLEADGKLMPQGMDIPISGEIKMTFDMKKK